MIDGGPATRADFVALLRSLVGRSIAAVTYYEIAYQDGGPPCFVDPMACNRLPVAPNCPAMNSGVEHLMHAETLVIGAPPDPLVAPDPHHNCIHFYRGAPSPAWLAVLNVGHVAWAANNDAEDIRITKRIQLALLLTRFYGATGLETDLPGGSVLNGNALVATHTRK